MRTTFVSSCIVACLAAPPTFGATYYLDASAGNDAWTGTQSTPATPNGPWRTLGRIASAALAPGDQILLKCGNIWHESLMLPASGSAANPIRIGSYPGNCSNPALIDGSAAIPAASWQLHSGRIYRANLPGSVIADAGFNQGVTAWRKWSPSGTSATISEGTECVPTGSRCLRFVAGTGMPNSILSSPSFPLDSQSYTLSFNIKGTAGTALRVAVRRDASPWDALGLDRTFSATGAWQTVTYTFRGASAISAARLDIEVPAHKSVSLDNVMLSVNMGLPQRVHVGGLPLEPAHHPNRGHDVTRPQSPYLSVAADSDQVSGANGSVSTFVTTGSDLKLPAGAALTPGLNVRIRTVAWLIDERKINSVSGNRLYLDAPTSYVLKSGWGYLLTGALWMLDSPGEWHHDPQANALYIWMPDGNPPENRVDVQSGGVGIDIAGKSNIIVEGISVRRMSVGIRMPNASGIVLRNLKITDIANEGIDASGAINATIENNSIVRTGRDAIAGLDRVTWKMADQLRIISNTISEAGVRVENGKVTGLPLRTNAAIHAGTRAYIYGNRVTHSGLNGIWPRADSVVEHNYIENACATLDDCAAIYLGHANNAQVRDNLIVLVPGAIDGKPASLRYSQGQGIYLDDLTTGATVSENNVINADHGIQVHNAFNNRIESNRLYGNRNYQLWFQEDSNKLRADGDIYGNVVNRNVMVPTNGNHSVAKTTLYAGASEFASYSGNIYSALMAQQMAREATTSTGIGYTFPEWQAARTPAGVPRNLDPDGRSVTLSGFASHRITGSNVIPNGSLSAGAGGWVSWNQLAPYGALSLGSCSVGPCLQYAVGASPGIVSSANFAVVKDQWYRVTFDLLTQDAGQMVRWVVRRGGGGTNLYEPLMGSEQKIFGTGGWTRYSFVFKASATVNVNDPVTLDRGARLDFHGDVSGQRFWIANAEMVSAAPVGASLRTQVVFNPAMSSQLVDCPDVGTNAGFCSKYVRLTDSAPISWPYSLPALGAEIIYSRGDTLADADGDGIADFQDACHGSPAGKQVNARGCAIGQ